MLGNMHAIDLFPISTNPHFAADMIHFSSYLYWIVPRANITETILFSALVIAERSA